MLGKNNRRRHERGFTLLEVMMSAAIFSVGVLGVVGLRVANINSVRSSARIAQATYLAREKAEVLLTTDFDNAALADSNSGNNPASATADFSSIPNTVVDPTAYVDGFDANAINVDGTDSSTTMAQGLGFQRVWQVANQDLNAQIAGVDAKKVKVTVRFRDGVNTTRMRQVSVVVVKAKVF